MKKNIEQSPFTKILLSMVVVFMVGGCSTVVKQEAVSNTAPMAATTNATVQAGALEDPNHIQIGDFVKVNYSMRLQSGELIITTRQDLAKDPSTAKAEWFLRQDNYTPEELIAGKEKDRQELAEAVLGMDAGESKTITLPPEKAFGSVDDKKIEAYPLEKSLPRIMNLTAAAFVRKFNAFPVVGDEVNFIQYFKSKVTAVTKNYATLEAMAVDGTVISADFGDTIIRLSDDKVTLCLSPVIGKPFTAGGREGVIRTVDDTTFSVDYNHPGAGESILMDVEIVFFEKASSFNTRELAWIENHDEGYTQAEQKKKPMVLVLYASWCGWSKRLLNETITDPRVQQYWDDFVWVKVDSDKEKAYKEIYGQNGFPMIVLVQSNGDIINEIDGFRDARALAKELNACLGNKMAEKG